MSVQSKTYTRAIAVIPSDNANIPNPALQLYAGQNNPAGPGPNELIGVVDFNDYGIKPGDIVYNITSQLAATITSFPIGGNILELNADIFTSTNQDFVIYAGTQNDASLSGCVLYVGSGGAFTVDTLSNDSITVSGIINGNILPIQVRKLYSTGFSAGNIVALW